MDTRQRVKEACGVLLAIAVELQHQGHTERSDVYCGICASLFADMACWDAEQAEQAADSFAKADVMVGRLESLGPWLE